MARALGPATRPQDLAQGTELTVLAEPQRLLHTCDCLIALFGIRRCSRWSVFDTRHASIDNLALMAPETFAPPLAVAQILRRF